MKVVPDWSIRHEASPPRGCASQGLREYTLELVRTQYRDFGPTLAVEALYERHCIKVGRETLRTWMVEAGLWASRRQRKSFHQPRLRRESYGELVQIDGSQHRWFEDRGEPCTLLVFIDDTTCRIMQLRFVRSESTDSYFEGSAEPRLPSCFLLRQAHCLPREQAGCARWSGDDVVRPRSCRAEHRDPVRELQPGKGPRGTSQPHAAGPPGEGVEACRRQRHGSRQRLPARVHGSLQTSASP